jgi:peptidyl-prolyl cis-trans isomerase D
MLKVMRESFHHLKWTLFAVIIVFVVGFVFFSGGSTGGGGLSNQTVAKIGGDAISAAEFDQRYRSVYQQQQSLYKGNLSPELVRALDLPRQVLDGMIDSRLQLDAAKRLRLQVSDDEVSNFVVSYSAFQQNGQFIGKERYQQLLAASRLSPERFEEEVRESLLAQKYLALVKASVLIPEAEVRKEFGVRNEKATIEYVRIAASRLESTAGPTDAELKTYYEKHKDRYRSPQQRRVKYLLVDRARASGKIVIPEPALRAEYERRKDSFAVPEQVTAAHILIRVDPSKGPAADALARDKAEKLAARVKAGEDFAKLANENTEDPSGKGNGGQLPPFSHGQMVPEFERAAFALEPRQISIPVKTQYGYHVIRVIARTPPRVSSFDEVRAQISSELAEKRAEAETDRRARELAERIKHLKNTSDEELRRLADTDAISYNETPWFSRGESIPGIGANPRFSDQAWALKVGQLSKDPVQTARGPALLKPTEERATGVAPFDEIKARVGLDLQAERREKEGLDKLQPAVRELNSGATLASIAQRYETEVKTTPEFAPGGPIPEIGTVPDLSAAVFSTPKGQTGPPVSAPGGFVLFRVLTKTTPDPVAFEAQKMEISDSLRSREAERLIRATLQQLRTEKKVEINEEILQSFLPQAGPGRSRAS